MLAAGHADGAVQRLQGLADALAAAFESESAHGHRVTAALQLGVLKEPDRVLLVIGDVPADGEVAQLRQLAGSGRAGRP
jgi:hypothetical protein